MIKSAFFLFTVLFFAFTISDGPVQGQESGQQTGIGSSNLKPDEITAVSSFTTSGRQVHLNGAPFYAKGVGYQPVPKGETPANFPNGDYFTSNYAHIYKPDVDKMRAMGVNLIKIYSWYPDHDHNDFLNYCYNNGVNPIYVAVGYFLEAGRVISNKNEYINQFRILAQHTYQHPAILGYMIGNETNNEGDIHNPQYWSALNEMAGAVKGVTRNKLTFIALVDDGVRTVIQGDRQFPNLDVWGINVFRGKSLGNLYSSYADASTKPLFISEIGFSATVRENGQAEPMPNNAQGVADYCRLLMTEIGNNNSANDPSKVVAGTIWFMFCDEWWKQNCPQCWHGITCSPADHNYSNQENGAFPGKWDDQEWFGLYTIERSPRAAVDVLRSFWNPAISNNITKIGDNSGELPMNFHLYQNYPNPFNPSTKIKFEIPQQSLTSITVYDITGKEIAVLLNDVVQAGSYEVEFNGANVSSGIYFYRIVSNGFTDIKKMIMVK